MEYAKSIAFELRKTILNGNQYKTVIAGSILRKKSFVHDIDILVNKTDEICRTWCSALIHAIPESGFIPEIKASGSYMDIPTQIWFCDESIWGPFLLEVTGPNTFNIFLRKRAKELGLLLSHNGLFNRETGQRIDNNTEGNIIWQILGKRWIPPEMRY